MPSDDVMIARLFPIVRSAYLLKSKNTGEFRQSGVEGSRRICRGSLP